jgi:serine/threonine-protein kinase
MENIMELDELKTAWLALERRLEQGNAINLQLYKEGRMKKLRSSLRPLYWGQILQMLFGLLFVLLAASFWPHHRDVPQMLASGLIVHAYGVLSIVMGGITIGMISRVNSDYSQPVLEIQKRLAQVRRFYVLGGMIVGLPWALIWLPLCVVLAGKVGVDLWTQAPSVFWIGGVVGMAILLGTWWFHHWSRSPKRPRLAQAMEDSVTGASLRKAGRILSELEQFEKE